MPFKKIEDEIQAFEKLLERLMKVWESIPNVKQSLLRGRLCQILSFIYFDNDGIYPVLEGIRDGHVTSVNEIEKNAKEWFKYSPEVHDAVMYICGLSTDILDNNDMHILRRIGDGKMQLRKEINEIWYDGSYFSDLNIAQQNAKGLLNMIGLLNSNIDRARTSLGCN